MFLWGLLKGAQDVINSLEGKDYRERFLEQATTLKQVIGWCVIMTIMEMLWEVPLFLYQKLKQSTTLGMNGNVKNAVMHGKQKLLSKGNFKKLNKNIFHGNNK